MYIILISKLDYKTDSRITNLLRFLYLRFSRLNREVFLYPGSKYWIC
jgi:hypothetical protein